MDRLLNTRSVNYERMLMCHGDGEHLYYPYMCMLVFIAIKCVFYYSMLSHIVI